MSRQFGTSPDFLLNQLLNVRFQILAADPGAPVEGQFWYNSTAKVFKYRTDVATITISDDTAALALKANIASPAFTGDPTVPTPAAGDNDLSIANTAWVKARIAELVASSPAALDTLNELAAAIGNDANFATTITNALAGKATKMPPQTIGDGVATNFVITHNLNSRGVVVSVYRADTFDEVEVDIQKTTANTITVGFSTPPANLSRIVSVIG